MTGCQQNSGAPSGAPLPLLLNFRLYLAATGTAATRTTAQGIGGREHKALLPAVVNIVDLDPAAFHAQILVDKVVKAVDLISFIAIFWFIQNQA